MSANNSAIQRAPYVVLVEVGVHRRQAVQEPLVRLARGREGLVVDGERYADSGQAGSPHFSGQIDVRPRHGSLVERDVNVVVHFDANHARDNFGDLKVNLIGRPHHDRPERRRHSDGSRDG